MRTKYLLPLRAQPNLNTWIRSDELRHLFSINDNFSRMENVDGLVFRIKGTRDIGSNQVFIYFVININKHYLGEVNFRPNKISPKSIRNRIYTNAQTFYESKRSSLSFLKITRNIVTIQSKEKILERSLISQRVHWQCYFEQKSSCSRVHSQYL